MRNQLNKNELTSLLFCPENCHAMYAAYRLDGYELITTMTFLAYQLHALDRHVMQKEADAAWGVQGRLLAWGCVHMQPAGLQTPPVTCTAASLCHFNVQWLHYLTIVIRTMWQTIHAASTLYTQGCSGSIDYVCQGTLFNKLLHYPCICIQKQTANEIAINSVTLVNS